MSGVNEGSLAFVGSGGTSPGVFMLKHEIQKWNVTGKANLTAPSVMHFSSERNLLFVANIEVEGAALNCLVPKYMSLQSVLYTTGSGARHICMGPRDERVYLVHRRSVTGFEVTQNGEIGKTVEANTFHTIFVFTNKTKIKVFVPPKFNPASKFMQRVFQIDSHCLGDLHIYIKFKNPMDTCILKPNSVLMNYFAYVVDSTRSSVLVFKLKSNRALFRLQLFPTVPELWIGSTLISSSVASEESPFLFVANCGHDSIVVYRLLLNGELRYVRCHSMPRGQQPRHLNCAKDVLYVATSDSIFIFQVAACDAMLTQINVISQIPDPTCTVFN